MKYILNLSIFTFLLVFGFSAKAQVEELSLQKCVSLGLKNHPDYQGSVLNAELAANGVADAKSNWLPEMGIFLNQGTNTGRSIDRFTNAFINEQYSSTFAQASLQQSIFQSFRIRHMVDAAELSKLSGNARVEAMKNNLTIRIVQSYLQVLQANELAIMTQKQYQASTEQFEMINEQVNAGVLARRDLLQIQTQQANDEFAALNARGQAEQAELMLFQLLNVQPIGQVSFVKINESSMDQIIALNTDQSVENLPEITAANYSIQSFDKQLLAVKASNRPSLNFFANYNTFYASSNPTEDFFQQLNATRNSSLSLGLSIPIFGRFQTNPQAQSLRIQQKIAQNDRRSSTLQLNQAYRTSVQNYKIAKRQYESARGQVAIGTENLDAVEAQLEAGIINSTDFILAKANLERANSNLLQAKYGFLLEQKIIQFFQNGDWDLD